MRAARMKSNSVRPSTAWVKIFTSTRPQPRARSGWCPTSTPWRTRRAVIELVRPGEATDHRLGQCPLDLTTHPEIIVLPKAAGARE